MLVIEAPVSFKVGSSGDFKVDGEIKRVVWRNENTLSIAPGFLHRIVSINEQDGMRRFTCTAARASKLEVHHEGGGIVFADRDGRRED
jgi:hypothetical protein